MLNRPLQSAHFSDKACQSGTKFKDDNENNKLIKVQLDCATTSSIEPRPSRLLLDGQSARAQVYFYSFIFVCARLSRWVRSNAATKISPLACQVTSELQTYMKWNNLVLAVQAASTSGELVDDGEPTRLAAASSHRLIKQHFMSRVGASVARPSCIAPTVVTSSMVD